MKCFFQESCFEQEEFYILQLHGLQEKENKPNDDTFLHESQNMTGSSLCAPDTLDFLQGISFFILNWLIPRYQHLAVRSYGSIFSWILFLSNSCR